MEDENLEENLKPKEVPEEHSENVINTEENIITNPPPSMTPISSHSNIVEVPPSSQAPSNKNSNANTDSMWYDLSIISWFLFLCTGFNFFTQNYSSLASYFGGYSPIGCNFSLPIGLISVIGTIGFIIYFNNTALKKSQNMINSFLNDMSKFHFVPLLITSFLFIIMSEPTVKASYIFGFIFSIIAYASSIFIYIKTDFEGEWYEVITTKKGVFSSLIALTLYTLCFSISHIGISENFKKGCGIAFSFIIGLLNIGFGFYFKDLVVLFVNLLIYFEMAKYYFSTYNYEGTKINSGVDGGIDIIMIICSIGAIFYLLFKQRDNIYK